MNFLKNLQSIFKSSMKDDNYWFTSTPAKNKNKILNKKGMNFRVYEAKNGIVVEFYEYNSLIGEYEFNLYIVNSYEEIGSSVGKIIFYEKLRR